MRFGVCTGSANAALVAQAGGDYLELGVVNELQPETEENAWQEQRARLRALPLPAETFNLFVPRHLRITGPQVDTGALERYVHTALARAAQVGGKVIVFGSGGARQLPEGFSRQEAEAQLLRFLGYCADAHDVTGVVVAVEPLNSRECNVITSVAEGARLVRLVDRPGVRNLADTYHMERDDEPLTAIVDSADCLAHVHTADTGRTAPGTGSYDHRALFQALRDARYNTRISIECSFTDLAHELAPALQHLKQAHVAAGKMGA